MEDINKIIGKNLSILRKQAKLTQLELAEKFNYSDKSVSKWESGDSMPSIDVLCQLAEFYGVTLDSLTHEETPVPEPVNNGEKKTKMFPSHLIITLLSVCAVWLVATVLFVVLKITKVGSLGMLFFWALPVSCIVLVVFNAIWGKMGYLFPILTVMLWSLLACLHIQLLLAIGYNAWPIYLLGVPLQVCVILWAALIKRTHKPKKSKQTTNDKPNSNQNETSVQ